MMRIHCLAGWVLVVLGCTLAWAGEANAADPERAGGAKKPTISDGDMLKFFESDTDSKTWNLKKNVTRVSKHLGMTGWDKARKIRFVNGEDFAFF